MQNTSPTKRGLPHSQIPGFERTEHPHIVRVPGIGRGEPIIENTRISVRLIAAYFKEGATVEEILQDYPHLNPAAVYDAVSYYLDHADEIEALIESHQIDNVLTRQGLMLKEDGVIYDPGDIAGE
jgi:uncharacterized protein (DUF433 family)